MKRKKTSGRRKGTPDKATRDVKALCASILNDPLYLRNLRQHAIERKLAPAVECLLFHYAYGVPRQPVEIDPPLGPIFQITQLPQLTPAPLRLPSSIDVQPDDKEQQPHIASSMSPGTWGSTIHARRWALSGST
jgi:hypothetical protein